MKLSIKNKIILPLLFLMIIPVIVVSVLSYGNYYKAISNNETMRINNELNDLLVLFNKTERNYDGKAFILDYIKSLNKRNMFIIEDEKFLYNTIADKDITAKKISKNISLDNKISPNYHLYYRVYYQWNWEIGFLLDKKEIYSKPYGISGSIVLLISIFIFFSLGAIILITDHISKPIAILLEGYNDIVSGNLKKKINIERKDELGLLGYAFNDMKNEITNRTNKFMQMKNFNEDILRSISTGIITTNIDGKIIKYNQSATHIIEKITQIEKVYPKIIKVLFKQIMNTLKIKKPINKVENFQNKKKGKNFYLDITTSLMKNNSGENIGVICSFHDISNRKKIEEKIDRINRLTSLGQLTAALAHEIRNPLSGMKMSTQVLKKRLAIHLKLSDEKLFDATIQEIDRLNGLITELLNFSKPNLPKIQIINVPEVLENALKFSTKIIDQKNLTVLKEYNEEISFAYFDKGQLIQIFLNIIANAVQAMNNEGILKIKISKSMEKDKHYMLLVFEDNGCGIKKENVSNIFDPFYTTNESGTGLGLSVVHKLMTANNGEIEVESRVNIGTKIKLYIPLYRREENEEKDINH